MHNQGIKDKGEHDYGKDIIHHIHAHVLHDAREGIILLFHHISIIVQGPSGYRESYSDYFVDILMK